MRVLFSDSDKVLHCIDAYDISAALLPGFTNLYHVMFHAVSSYACEMEIGTYNAMIQQLMRWEFCDMRHFVFEEVD